MQWQTCQVTLMTPIFVIDTKIDKDDRNYPILETFSCPPNEEEEYILRDSINSIRVLDALTYWPYFSLDTMFVSRDL